MDGTNLEPFFFCGRLTTSYKSRKKTEGWIYMGKVAILAEKPSQAKAYAEAFTLKHRDTVMIELEKCSTFPDGAIITWGIGHLVELQQPEEYDPKWKTWRMDTLPILPAKYKHKVAKGKVAQFEYIKRLFNDPSIETLINAADIDREGSNIFYSILQMTGVKNKPVKRLWINSLEADEVRKGFNNLHDNKKDLMLYDEAKARQISDWLVGMNFSRLYTILMKQKGFDGVLPIGRVQSPTIYLIYERQKEIANFVAKPFYELEGQFKAKNGEYKGKAKIKSEDKKEVESLMNKHGITGEEDGSVHSVTKKEKRVKSPKLHALSTLQAVANKRWKYSPASVLLTVQNLYEKKLLSYPRTDTQFITENEFAYLVKNLKGYMDIADARFTPVSTKPNKRYVDGAKVSEHYAIIPTKMLPKANELAKLSTEENNIYFEVLNTTLAMFHEDYVYEETKIITEVKGLQFDTTGNTEVSKGWKALFPVEKKGNGDQALPILVKGESVDAKVGIRKGMTSPPKPYTEGELINMMKTCGKNLEDSEEGEIMKEVEGLGTEATRSNIIETIKKHEYIAVQKNIVSVTDKGIVLCEAIEGTLLSSPSMTAKWETYLKKIGNGNGSKDLFLGNIGKFIQTMIEEVPTKIQGATFTNTSTGKTSAGKSGGAEGIALCPACKKGKLFSHKTFYGCTEYKGGCKFTLPTVMLGKKLTQKNIKDLCEKGKTGLVKGMTSKAKKPFDAILKLEAGSIKFEFPEKKIS